MLHERKYLWSETLWVSVTNNVHKCILVCPIIVTMFFQVCPSVHDGDQISPDLPLCPHVYASTLKCTPECVS